MLFRLHIHYSLGGGGVTQGVVRIFSSTCPKPRSWVGVTRPPTSPGNYTARSLTTDFTSPTQPGVILCFAESPTAPFKEQRAAKVAEFAKSLYQTDRQSRRRRRRRRRRKRSVYSLQLEEFVRPLPLFLMKLLLHL